MLMSSAEGSRRRKEVKYKEIVEMSQAAGYRAKMFTFEVGSMKIVMDDDIKNNKASFQRPWRLLQQT